MKKKKSGARAKTTPPSRPRRVLLARLVLALIAVLGVVALGIWWDYSRYTRAELIPKGERRLLVIASGSTWRDVVEESVRQGLIRKPLYFDAWGRGKGLDRKVKAGTYELKGPLTLEDLSGELERGGRTDGVEVTIPEGFTIFHIADRLEEAGLVSRREFIEAARSKYLLRSYEVPGESFEGYLFPDTYRLAEGSSAQQIIARLHKRWEEVVGELLARHPEALRKAKQKRDLGLHEIITIASMIERETDYDPERAIIARVFLNRIDRDMRLQTDPSCVYGEATYKDIPSPKHCKDEHNRYSTYVIKGLPPGPISNPGLESLEAALLPAEDEKARSYIFFVAKRDGSGSHQFTATYAEHKQAIREFLK